MYFLYFTILGIAVFGGEFVRYQILGLPIFYIAIFMTFISYIQFLFKYSFKIFLCNSTKKILFFWCYCLIVVLLSVIDFYSIFSISDLYRSMYFIPRQAYYLMFFPVIILMQNDEYTDKLYTMAKKYNSYIFWSIYILHVIIKGDFSLSVPTVFILCGLSLLTFEKINYLSNILKVFAIILTPIAVGGEMTNAIIRLIYACCLWLHNKKYLLVHILRYGFAFMIISVFLMPAFSSIFEDVLDVNSSWRLMYWKDELYQLLRTSFIGVGYGTSYATEEFILNVGSVTSGPFAEDDQFSFYEKLFVVGPHNSYVSIAFRTGLIGIYLFFASLYSIAVKMNQSTNIFAVFMFFAAVVLIGVNVGLESPYYMLLFIFSLGISINDMYRIGEKKRYALMGKVDL